MNYDFLNFVAKNDKLFMSWVRHAFSGCWLWTGHLMKNGYGQLCRKNKGKRNFCLVHRYSWMMHKGRIPDGMKVLHKCDVRHCVNPEHLFIGTQQDNITDMIKKGRKNARKGSKVPGAILTEKDIPVIRKRIADGERIVKIAADYDIDESNIYRIRNGRIWRHA